MPKNGSIFFTIFQTFMSGPPKDGKPSPYRISVTLRSTLRDANTHFVNASTSYDYIQSDDTHPTYYLSSTIGLNIFTGTGSGSGAPDFTAAQIVNGQNPQWNKWGHERMGWGLSVFNPATP